MLTTQTLTVIAAIGAFIVPPIVSFLKNEKWSTSIKQLIAGAVAVVVVVVALLVTAPADFTTLNLAVLIGLVYSGSQIVYGVYFKNSTVSNALTNVFYGNAVNAKSTVKSTTTTATTTTATK